VTSPLNVFVPVVELRVIVAPPFTVVAPDTVKPLSTVTLPDTVSEAQDCAAPNPVTESPDGIVTVSLAPGIWAGDQFAAVFQLPLATLNEIAVPKQFAAYRSATAAVTIVRICFIFIGVFIVTVYCFQQLTIYCLLSRPQAAPTATNPVKVAKSAI
jgi:hypothetical protein